MVSKYGMDNQVSLAMLLGKISAYQGMGALNLMINGLADIMQQARPLSCLDIYAETGNSDHYCNSFVRLAQSLGKSVRLAGTFPPDEIGRILRSLHVLIVPSIWYESIPLVLRSALNAGTPVIVSRMGGLTEPLSGDSFRQSFPAGDAGALCDLILDLLNDPQRITRLRRDVAGKARTIAHYLDDVETLYHEVAR